MQIEKFPDSKSCWDLLERVAASTQLRRATRLQELLLYVGKRSLKDGCDRIPEQEIGSHVFHRPAAYDTGVDNIVRTNVSDLRKRIEAYFSSEGSYEPLIMEIPRGSYIPVFRLRSLKPEPAEKIHEIAAAVPNLIAERHFQSSRWLPAALAAAGLLIVLLAATSLYFWSQYRSLHRSVFAWQYKPAVDEFWSRILDANPNTDIVISDAGVGLTQALTKNSFPLNDYLSRGYVSQLQTANLSPDMHTAIDRILAWNLGSPDEFMLARRILTLDPERKNLHLYYARNYVPDLIKRDNVILIGARRSNPWVELFDNRLNFVKELDSRRVINRAPAAGEQAVYVPANDDGYCVVAYLPNSENTGQVLLIEGTNAEATEAAGDFLLSEDQLARFKGMLHVSTLGYFQVLLKVSSVRGTPLATTVVAYRTSVAGPKTVAP